MLHCFRLGHTLRQERWSVGYLLYPWLWISGKAFPRYTHKKKKYALCDSAWRRGHRDWLFDSSALRAMQIRVARAVVHR